MSILRLTKSTHACAKIRAERMRTQKIRTECMRGVNFRGRVQKACDMMSRSVTGPSDLIGLRGDTNRPPPHPSGEGGAPIKHF